MVQVAGFGAIGEAETDGRSRRDTGDLARRPAERRSFIDEGADASPISAAWFRAAPAVYHMAPPTAVRRPRGALAVIPTLNEAPHIEDLIRRLLSDPHWDNPLVVVADGGSTDGTVAIVKALAARDARVRLLHNPQRLQSAAINRAVAEYGKAYRWMVRVDAHAEYPLNYVSGLMAQVERVGAASVVVAMSTRGCGGFQTAAAAAQNSVLGAGGAPHRACGRSGWVDHGHHALFDLEHFLGAGGYDESYAANEDAEFDARLARAHGRIWLSQDLRIVYYPRAEPLALFRQYLNYGQGRARTLLQHRLKPKIRQLLPAAVAPAVALLPLGVIEPVLALPALGWAGVCLAYGLVLGCRNRDPAAAASGLAAMIMHLAWSIGFWRQLLKPRPAPSASDVLVKAEARQ